MSSSTSKTPAITPRQTMRGHSNWVNGVAHLPDGRRIITCSSDGSLRLWDLKSGTQIGKKWRDENVGVWSMALSPNGEIVASGCDDGKVRLWDVERRKVIAKFTGHINVVCLCWSADELATGGYENGVKIWDAKTGKRLNKLKHDGMVYCLAWTSDGKKLISGSFSLIRIFDTATWKQIAVLEGHTHFVYAISLSSNDRLLVGASYDKTARLWNLDTNLPVGPPLHHEQDLHSVALSPDGKVLVTGCANKNAYTWDVHAILKEAGIEDLPLIGPNFAPKDTQKQIAPEDDAGTRRTPRSSLSDKSFLEANATGCPDQFGSVDDLPPGFFAGIEANVDSSAMGVSHPDSSVNAFLTRLSSLLHRFRPDNGEPTELPQPSRPSAFHPHVLLARLSSLIHSSPSENDAPDELQQPSTPTRLDPHVLLARLSSFLRQSRLNADEEAEPHHTTPSSSHSDALISRLTSLFRSQPHNNEEIELTQRPSRPRVVEVAAVRDKKALVVARGPQFEKAKRAYEQARLHAQAQASSSQTQPADTSTSTTHPAPVTAAAQSPPISWWAQIVLFFCCAHPSHTNGHQHG